VKNHVKHSTMGPLLLLIIIPRSLAFSPLSVARSFQSTHPTMTMTRFQPKPSQSQSQSQLHVATLESMASAPTARRIVAFSNLDGKALNNEASSFPTAGQLKAVIPKECFTSTDTTTSLMYLGLSASLSAVCVAAGFAMLPLVPPSLLSAPIWLAYAAVAGTVEMGLWVLAHECGHGAFSKDLRVQDTVGFVLHSILLVPYYSWQRSHAIHHRFTNHMELGETHVPEGEEAKWLQTLHRHLQLHDIKYRLYPLLN